MGYITEIIKDIQQGNATELAADYAAYQAALVPSPLDGRVAKTDAQKHQDFLVQVLPAFYQKMDEYFAKMAQAVHAHQINKFNTLAHECWNFYQAATTVFYLEPTTNKTLLEAEMPAIYNKKLWPKCIDQNDLFVCFTQNTFSGIVHNAQCPPLYLAAQKNNTSIFTVLWNAMTAKNNYSALKIPLSSTGDLPIHAAIRAGQWATATTLVARYSYEQLTVIKNKDGQTALSLAQAANPPQATLVAAINARQPVVAVANGLSQNIQNITASATNFSTLTISATTDIATRDTNQDTPLHLAARHQNQNLLAYILTTLDDQIRNDVQQNYQSKHGYTAPLLRNNLVIGLATRFSPSSVPLSGDAILSKDTNTALNAGITIKVNLQNNKGETPLHVAAAAGNAMAIEALLFYGASTSLNTQDSTGELPIHKAARSGNQDAIKLLLKASNNITAVNAQGENALHLVVQRRDFAATGALEALLDSTNVQAALSRLDNNGNPAIHVAFQQGNFAVVKKILEKDNTQASVKNRDQQTILHLALANQNSPVDFIKTVLDISNAASYDLINNTDAQGNTALHIACRENNLAAVQELLNDKYHADFDLANSQGHLAQSLTQDKDIQKLIEQKRLAAAKDKSVVTTPPRIKKTGMAGLEKIDRYLDRLNNFIKLKKNKQSQRFAQLTNDYIKDIQNKSPEYVLNRTMAYKTSVEPYLSALPYPTLRACAYALMGCIVGAALAMLVVWGGAAALTAWAGLDLAFHISALFTVEMTVASVTAPVYYAYGAAAVVSAGAAAHYMRPTNYKNALTDKVEALKPVPTKGWFS